MSVCTSISPFQLSDLQIKTIKSDDLIFRLYINSIVLMKIS